MSEQHSSYSFSHAHRDTISHVAHVHDKVLLASIDGVLQFFVVSKNSQLESAKIIKAHSAPLTCLAVMNNYCVTASLDKSCKLFDCMNVDLLVSKRFSEVPECMCIVDDPLISADLLVFGAFRDQQNIFYFVGSDLEEIVLSVTSPVVSMAYCKKLGHLIIGHESGHLATYGVKALVKERIVKPHHSISTDRPFNFTVSPDGDYLGFFSASRQVVIMRIKDFKIFRKYDESIEFYEKMSVKKNFDQSKKEKLIQQEGQIGNSPYMYMQNVVFDHDSMAVLYPSPMGIKCIDFHENKTMEIYGRSDGFRPICISFIQPSILLASAFRHTRAYIYSDMQSQNGDRDQPPHPSLPIDQSTASPNTAAPTNSYTPGHKAIIRTTKGDIHIALYPTICPKTVENFCRLARTNYYDNLLFHRVIRGFIIQTGDPHGDGTGGESCWGRPFENELSSELKHDRPFCLSMANDGRPCSNSSQFFITTIRAPWLDRKHTVFGRVVKGEDVVKQIEAVDTDRLDRPKQDVRVLTVEIIE